MAEAYPNGDIELRDQRTSVTFTPDVPGTRYVDVYHQAEVIRDDDVRNEEMEKDIIKRKIKETVTCSQLKAKKIALRMFPFLGIMKKYKWRSDLINDVLAGLTVGIMQLPQGMAYSLLADVPMYVGLYTSFFPVIVYFFFGTSKHVSMGSAAILSLMTGSFVASLASQWRETNGLGHEESDLNLTQEWQDKETDFKVSIAASSAFIAGAMQLAMGFLHVGFLTTYMSESMVQGFTTAAAFLGFSSQIKYLLGINVKRYPTLFQVINTYVDIFKRIPETNVASLVISLICIISLHISKIIKQRYGPKIKSREGQTKRKIIALVPVELIVIVVATLASHYGEFNDRWNVRVVGKIPRRLPAPTFPGFINASQYVTDSLMIGIVAFAQSISLALLMARENNYNIDSNQELIGSGIGNMVGSFFSCMPMGASISRTSIQNSMRGKSQVSSLVSATLVMMMLIAFGKYLENLPVCILSSVVMVSLTGIFLHIFQLRKLFDKSPFDCAIWIVAFLSVLVLHVTLGLVVSIVFSFFTVVCRSQITKVTTLEHLPDFDEYTPSALYSTTDIRIVTYKSPVYYANSEIFIKKLYTETGVNPGEIRQVHTNEEAQSFIPPFRCLVIDCAAVTFIDRAGIEAFEKVIDDYNDMDISTYLGGVGDEVLNMFKKSDFMKKYASIHDTTKGAVVAAQEYLNLIIRLENQV